ncbi:myotubularin-related protein 7-like isoform X2 [Xenia sp. Carnegie-2017]|uniref:myotubularin-related protein 7-like isoform X2 n=1 Tax=Xenia sp. Carnegie-2017 TaxID=2897299 RepID=UPI001F0485B2|nr:myotubularin-related protein 7-like isoform X2 [Xenia sp. Carnegie-2017]
MFHFYFRASLKTLTVLQGKHSSNEGAITIVQHVDEKGIAALIHCSDGWDRTAQLSSISQILLDPYYRTIKRFQILVCLGQVCVGTSMLSFKELLSFALEFY